ncbi:hypothetical protein NEOLEDRAFT_1180290 [Neolentinus lepideus HHB14362 ss-1]|uniref:CSD1 domain-containing protein n=1 Tax=Neolentinus lepideus HHB14362 ss-1 TaxID=1314782 RepID=A0A165R375_9AGAM|nr:hypothetical protein NEOLEDRAFT_1180290 [Neolentinus lepideus HHB14362 ss-1]
MYTDYLPTATVLAGVKSGQLHQGHFNANPYNYLIHINVLGSVSVPAFNKPVPLVGREKMNLAVHGDVVAVEVFEWSIKRNDHAEDSEEEGEGEEVLKQENKVIQSEETKHTASQKQPTGHIVSIIKRNWRASVLHPLSTTIFHRAKPDPLSLDTSAIST